MNLEEIVSKENMHNISDISMLEIPTKEKSECDNRLFFLKDLTKEDIEIAIIGLNYIRDELSNNPKLVIRDIALINLKNYFEPKKHDLITLRDLWVCWESIDYDDLKKQFLFCVSLTLSDFSYFYKIGVDIVTKQMLEESKNKIRLLETRSNFYNTIYKN